MANKYIYLDREYAKKGISMVYRVEDTAVEGYKEYFEGKAIEFVGEDLPHYITYVPATETEEEKVREATKFERYQRGDYQLNEGETFINGELTTFDPMTQKIVDDKIVEKTREDLIADGTITLERELAKCRADRKKHLDAIDLYDKAVLRGDIKETPEMKANRDKIRQAWLDLPNGYTDLKQPIEELYPKMPDAINYFINA